MQEKNMKYMHNILKKLQLHHIKSQGFVYDHLVVQLFFCDQL